MLHGQEMLTAHSWTCGPDWPNGGEIDIIEGINAQKTNLMSLHTSASCSVQAAGSFTGVSISNNCTVGPDNAGCSVDASTSLSYGDAFNQASGGAYAMEWTVQGIRVWHFARDLIPPDIAAGSPDPTGWPTPLAAFSGQCPFDEGFRDQKIVPRPPSFSLLPYSTDHLVSDL